MSERKEKPQASPEEGAQQSSPQNNGEAFQRAENLLAVGNEDGDERARQAFVGIEDGEAADRQSNLISDSDALTQGIAADQRGNGDALTPPPTMPSTKRRGKSALQPPTTQLESYGT
jgi:hypothetical protein